MRLIIDIDEKDYKLCKKNISLKLTPSKAEQYIASGVPFVETRCSDCKYYPDYSNEGIKKCITCRSVHSNFEQAKEDNNGKVAEVDK